MFKFILSLFVEKDNRCSNCLWCVNHQCRLNPAEPVMISKNLKHEFIFEYPYLKNPEQTVCGKHKNG
jgi:hypothetical protein